jgi:hypothetical protein
MSLQLPANQQLLEQAFTLTNHAQSSLAKLYHYKATLLTNLDEMSRNPKHKLYFLKDPELLKLRAKVEKKFPTVPDLNKVCFCCVLDSFMIFSIVG